jgi:hypothetical protein
MDALIFFIAMIVALGLFDYAALRWGADSRDHLTATWYTNEPFRRGI